MKTDARGGEPMEGVTFTLYEDANANGALDDGEKSVFSGATDAEGSLTVPGPEGALVAGDYLLVETVPEGCVDADGPISVVVDAGAEKDGVSVEQRIGALVYSMRSFAADDRVDSTLHEVKAQPQVAGAYEGARTDWQSAGSPELHFSYRDEGDQHSLTYQPSNGSAASFVVRSGWSRLAVTQCLDPAHEEGNDTDYRQGLGDQSLNAIFTGNVIVHVENEPVVPGGPTEPGEPEEPDDPDAPGESTEPGEPDEPVDPVEPDAPEAAGDESPESPGAAGASEETGNVLPKAGERRGFDVVAVALLGVLALLAALLVRRLRGGAGRS